MAPVRPAHPRLGTIGINRLGCSETQTVGMVLAAYFTYSMTIISHPITEGHAFRQTQTAFIMRGFLRSGINLWHPIVPVYGPKSQIPYELPWFQAIAAVISRLGQLSETAALRTTSTAFTLLSAFFVYRVTRRMAGRRAATAAIVLFLFSPFTLRWGRASLIESFTTAMTLAWVLSLVVFPNEPRRSTRNVVLGSIAGAIAATSKITTFLPWGVFLLPTLLRHLRSRQWAPAGAMASSAGLSMGAGLLWTRHADKIKGAQTFTGWLTSQRLQTFNLGTVAQRLSSDTWATIGGRSLFLILGPIGLIGLSCSLRSRHHPILLDTVGLLGVYGTAIGIFTNLYVAHDYYQVAIAPALAIPMGIGIAGIVCQVPIISLRLITVSTLASTLALSSVYVRQTVNGARDFRDLSASIKANTAAASGAIVTGLGWSSEILYYADRWGVMADGNIVTAGRLRSEPYRNRLQTLTAVNGFDEVTIDIMNSVDWVAPADKFTFQLGAFGRGMRKPPKLLRTVLYPARTVERRGTPLNIRCDGVLHPIGQTTWRIGIENRSVTFGSDNWRLPALAGIVRTNASALRCSGGNGTPLTLEPVSKDWKP
jgi:4-amino-4-deoxy-L-arabinose transferase-like glycosyltransferase